MEFLIFAASGAAAAYTHYFAFVSIIIITGILFWAIVIKKRERLVKWLISAAGMIAAYLPWTPFFIRQVTSVEAGYWIPEITAEAVWGYFTWTFDFSQDFRTVWFLHTEWMPEIDEAVLAGNGLKMDVIGHYGIEHNEFDIYMIYRE